MDTRQKTAQRNVDAIIERSADILGQLRYARTRPHLAKDKETLGEGIAYYRGRLAASRVLLVLLNPKMVPYTLRGIEALKNASGMLLEDATRPFQRAYLKGRHEVYSDTYNTLTAQ